MTETCEQTNAKTRNKGSDFRLNFTPQPYATSRHDCFALRTLLNYMMNYMNSLGVLQSGLIIKPLAHDVNYTLLPRRF
jgi:hypothetical protein